MNNISYMFLQFIVYSFIGYVLEVLYCSFIQKKVVNRGFLFGPICPIYGIGAILLLYSLANLKDNPILVFFFGMFITSTLEYFTSYIFEKIFNNKWWDYSNRSDNINGRVCLENSIYFGIGTLAIIYIVSPIVDSFLNGIPSNISFIICLILMIIFIFDFIWSVIIAYNLRSRLIIAEELKSAKLKLIPQIFEKNNFDKLAKIRFKQNRLIKNYPNLAKDLRKELNDVYKMVVDVKNVKKDSKKSIKK